MSLSDRAPASAGLHHVTAIAGAPRRNVAFHTGLLGQRLVKKTVNFDDPGTWHLYYGDQAGRPGTILTFFPWPNAAPGRIGAGETHETGFLVPQGTLADWERRFSEERVAFKRIRRFGAEVVTFADPDGMQFSLTEAPTGAAHDGNPTILGFDGVTLGVAEPSATAQVLTDIFGYRAVGEEDGRLRFASATDGLGSHIDLVTVPAERGRLGAGTVHHIAFRAQSDEHQAAMAQALTQTLRIAVMPQKDRNYFRSVYFREPGGVLFEIATDAPGFAVDEPAETMGSRLMLPPQYEASRARIEATLPPL